MADRIERYLEGTLGRNALTDRERADGDAAARAVDEARAFLAARPTPDLTGAVMRRLAQRAGPAPARRVQVLDRFARALWTPRQISVRPAYALLAAGTCVAALFSIAPALWRASSGQPGIPEAAPRLFVQFRLQTQASKVQLAGTFTNWQPAYELHQTAPGIWTITVPLSQGVHDYAFVVDGQQWIPDPYAPPISDGFGGTNSRLTVLVPETPRT